MKKTENNEKENPYLISYDKYMDTNACTECTGLMYRAPAGREEWDSYHEVFDFTPEPEDNDLK